MDDEVQVAAITVQSWQQCGNSKGQLKLAYNSTKGVVRLKIRNIAFVKLSYSLETFVTGNYYLPPCYNIEWNDGTDYKITCGCLSVASPTAAYGRNSHSILMSLCAIFGIKSKIEFVRGSKFDHPFPNFTQIFILMMYFQWE